MIKEKHYQPFTTFILRTPLLPFGRIKKLTESKHISVEQIIDFVNDPFIKEALYLASPGFYYEIERFLIENQNKNCIETDREKDIKLIAGVFRYLVRMSTRCTPFGLFAGITAGMYGSETNIQFFEHNQAINHTRLDMDFLCRFANDISRISGLKEYLNFFPNTSLYAIGQQLRYVEYKNIRSSRIHNIVAVDNTHYLSQILDKAQDGAKISELAEILVNDLISSVEAYEFINELINSQILISELEPTLSGDDLLLQIVRLLKTIVADNASDEITKIISNLEIIKSELNRIKDNNPGIGKPVLKYEKIIDLVKQLKIDYDIQFLFQTDMVKPAKTCNLNHNIINEIYPALEILNNLSPSFPPYNLDKFREAFYDRYEDEEIPILEALDIETGIGYLQNTTIGISPLIDGLAIEEVKNHKLSINWDESYSFIYKKYAQALEKNSYTIEITDDDLNSFSAKWDDLPETMIAFIQVIEHTEDKIHKLYIKSAGGGASAANLISRFSYTDKKVLNLTKEIIDKDEKQNNDMLYAEIIHLPEARTGNILLRPILRKYEIPYLSKSGIQKDFQIQPSDLLVSVRNNQIVLRSKKLNKQIIPRLSSAHNFEYNPLPIYHFLCDLQSQNLRRGLEFSWGPFSKLYRFYPRIIYKNVILSRASWNFFDSDIVYLNKTRELKDKISHFQSLFQSFKIPDEVILAEDDNELYLNLSNEFCIKILINLVKKKKFFTLKEFLFTEKNLFINGPDGGFTNEFLIPFYRNREKSVF